jgi:hypothetical protein
MRWKFPNIADSRETAEREVLIERIDFWWKEFQSTSDEIASVFERGATLNIPEWMHAHLHAVDPRIMWEYGPAIRGSGHRLVLTSESRSHLRPLIDALLARAPSIEGWKFYGFRPAEETPLAVATAKGRCQIDVSNYKVKVRRGEYHRIDLCYYSEAIQGPDDNAALHGAFVATESLLGEACLEQWIGLIEVAPLKNNGWGRRLLGRSTPKDQSLLPLDRLKETVDALIGNIQEQLPKLPHYLWPDEAEWTVWELNPETTPEELAQADLIVARSCNRPMWTAAHSSDDFYSTRFSGVGETFCYVRIDGSDWPDDVEFADKSEIEDALDAVLRPNSLGCAIGGGMGLQYMYVDLALADLEAGIEAVRQRLQAGRAPKESWIQFYDATLAMEWVGIYDDSPTPPLPQHDD